MYKKEWEETKKKNRDLCIHNGRYWRVCPLWSSNDTDAQILVTWLFSTGDVVEITQHIEDPYYVDADTKRISTDANDMPYLVTIHVLSSMISANSKILAYGWTFAEAMSNAICTYYRGKNEV
jgi:hypothetical protein